MIVAIFTVHIDQGWNGMRFPILLLAVMVRYTGTEGYCLMKELLSNKKKK